MMKTIGEQGLLALKSPLTYALLVIAVMAGYFANAFTNRSNDTIRSCYEQVVILNERVSALEKMHDEYTRAMLFKDIQTREQAIIIDSLKRQ